MNKLIVLGTCQDGGYPQSGCTASCCKDVASDSKLISSIAITNDTQDECWIVDASPDIKHQLNIIRKYISKDAAELLATDLYHADEKEPHENLSDREFEILKMIARGLTTKVIAAELLISPKTVSTYRSRILEKLDLHNNSDIIHYVIDYSLAD